MNKEFTHKPKQKSNKEILAELITTLDSSNLRYNYYRDDVTAVSYRIKDELIIAFAFCSHKDTFTKAIGKIQCIKRIKDYLADPDSEHMYVGSIPFLKIPTSISMAIVYNQLKDKPIRFMNTKFIFSEAFLDID
jgi:hypothetical protein